MPAMARQASMDKATKPEEAKGKGEAPPGQEPATGQAGVELRSNFAETAFWEPHLLTGADGTATIEFVVPDSVTSWRVFVHGVTRDLAGGTLEAEAKSVKDLMVRPYLPRFFREGDKAELRVMVNNAGEAALSGEVTLEITDPLTGENLAPAFGLPAAVPARAFKVEAGGGAPVVFPLAAPARVGTVAFKVVARSGALSDGELRPLPVLPGRMHLVQSRFATLKEGKTRELRFDDMARTDDATRINEQLVVTVDAQLFYGLLEALPYLVNYPYECTEQTLNRFLATGILTSLYGKYPQVARMAQELSKRETVYETFDAADPNRKMALEETPWLQTAQGGKDAGMGIEKVLDPRVAKAQRETSLAKLLKAQTSLGAFPWWPGGPPSPYMTLYIVSGLSKAVEFGVEVPKDAVVRAFGYLHRHYLDEIVSTLMAHDTGWEFVTFLNYTIGNFPDVSWTGGVFTDAERKTMLDFSFKHWKDHSPYLKGYLALTLKRSARPKDAGLVWASVMDSAKTTEDGGTSWAPEDRGWLWYNDTIETQAFALRTLMEIAPADARSEGLVQWLFLNKKLNHWKSTRATSEVIYSVAWFLKKTGRAGGPRDDHGRGLRHEDDVHLRAGQVHGQEESARHRRRQARAGVRHRPGDEGRQGPGLRQRDLALQHGEDAGEGRRGSLRRREDLFQAGDEGRGGRAEAARGWRAARRGRRDRGAALDQGPAPGRIRPLAGPAAVGVRAGDAHVRLQVGFGPGALRGDPGQRHELLHGVAARGRVHAQAPDPLRHGRDVQGRAGDAAVDVRPRIRRLFGGGPGDDKIEAEGVKPTLFQFSAVSGRAVGPKIEKV